MKKKANKLVIKNPKRLVLTISIIIIIVVSIVSITSNNSKAQTSETAIETVEISKEEKKLVSETPMEKMSEKELEELEKKLLEEIDNEEVKPITYYKLSKIKLIKGEEEKAIEYANKAINIDSENMVNKISEDESFSKILDKLQISAQSEENEKEENEEERKQEENKSEKKDEAKASNPTGNTKYYIKVNYGANVVTVYTKDENGYFSIPVKAMVCSTGTATPRSGVYSIKNKWTWGKLFGNVWGHYTTKIVGNILFHSVPYLSADPSSLEYWEYDKLGTSASMGCVRLKVADAKWIFDNMPSGTPVEFYSDSNPGPLGKPGSQKISGNEQCRGWDPTDPDGRNPWKNVQNSEDEKKKEEEAKKKQEEENEKKRQEEAKKKQEEEAEKKKQENAVKIKNNNVTTNMTTNNNTKTTANVNTNVNTNTNTNKNTTATTTKNTNTKTVNNTANNATKANEIANAINTTVSNTKK